MKLLIITQKVDSLDPVLGFFCAWIAEFAKHADKVTVICLAEGTHNLPNNVRIIPLGSGKIGRLIQLISTSIRYRNSYDAVFVHMNPEYVLSGGVIWKLLGKYIGFWYTHKSVTWKLRIAEKLADIVFTASQESFRLPSKKLQVMGHGIDVDRFIPSLKQSSESFNILSVGRISTAKDYETIIHGILFLQKQMQIPIRLDIIGIPVIASDYVYLKHLKALVEEYGLENTIRFLGPVPHEELPQIFSAADVFVHTSKTGSLDKVLLEAMASGIPVVSSSDVAKNLLVDSRLVVAAGDPEALSRAILRILAMNPRERSAIGTELRNIVVRDHDITRLIKKIISNFPCGISK